jgi:hypothetical protein
MNMTFRRGSYDLDEPAACSERQEDSVNRENPIERRLRERSRHLNVLILFNPEADNPDEYAVIGGPDFLSSITSSVIPPECPLAVQGFGKDAELLHGTDGSQRCVFN